MIVTAVISIKYYRGDIMDEQFIRDRLSFLRTQKGISEYKMSKSYIQSISNGRALPSLSEFLYICDYLGVTPMEFFDTSSTSPLLAHELSELTKDMCKEDLEALITMAKRIKAK